jgi:hypothetical protein
MIFEMSPNQMKELLSYMQPVPMFALNCGTPPSPQENANAAWASLGKEMGFDSTTVKPYGSNQLQFTATPIEVPNA